MTATPQNPVEQINGDMPNLPEDRQPNQKPVDHRGFGRRISTIRPHASTFLRRSLGTSMSLAKKGNSHTYRYWPDSKIFLDQGTTPQCVAYAWLHLLLDSPVTYGDLIRKKKVTTQQLQTAATEFYQLAQEADEWPGSAYDGTSVRAGAEILLKTVAKSLGATVVEAVQWGTTLTEIIDSVLHKGPVVLGTNWYSSMMTPGTDGVVEVSGTVVGGHAYILNGANLKTRAFRLKNSWGRGWGKNGRAYIGFDSIERLLKEDGEAAVVTERKRQ